MQDIGTLPGDYTATAYGINNSGQIVGGSGGQGRTHAFLFNDGVMQDLGTLGGANSDALAINNLGHVIGISELSGSALGHSFLYSGGTMKDLGLLGGSGTFAYGINDLDQVVGYGDLATGQRAFLYNGGALCNLNDLIDPTLGITLDRGVGINDAGQIAGYGVINGGPVQAFVLTPTPEPGGACFLGVAAFELLTRRPRRC